jgi:uncharacterized protein YjlB
MNVTVETLVPSNGVVVQRVFVPPDGTFPNNGRWPLLLYRSVYDAASDGDGAALLRANGWTDPWAWGVFDFHHYHTTAWEALLCVRGEADIQFGGPTGPVLTPTAGDLVLVPPGVAHRQGRSTDGFLLLGAYPDHSGCRTPEADTVKGPATVRQLAAVQECPPPRLCPRWGAACPWKGGLARLMERGPDVGGGRGGGGGGGGGGSDGYR